MKWMGQVAHMWKKRNGYKVLIQKCEGRRPLARTTNIWEDNIKIDLNETGLGSVNWFYLASDRI
jgi:hypothetical protein